jgi:hypothetical protein
MRKTVLLSYFLFLISILSLPEYLFSQNVGIGTNSPNAKAILEIKATDKGILFPRMTTAQRNAIATPPDGLHIFNTDERCMNYYDSIRQIWNCYCFDCQTEVINITSNACKVDFYNSYAKGSPAKKYLVNISAAVVISGCIDGDTALSFSNMPAGMAVTINNYGTIAGAGGSGGTGALESGCVMSTFPLGGVGKTGGDAISTKAGVLIIVNNYGVIAGGGGGGGGSTKNPNGQGGGGGGGAGMIGGMGGQGGSVYQSSGPPFNFCIVAVTAQPGAVGQPTAGGLGGAGVSGGAAGGNGGLRGQPGQNGTGALAGTGGLAGKAIRGGSGNIINNISGGQSFGLAD